MTRTIKKKIIIQNKKNEKVKTIKNYKTIEKS